MQYSNCPAKAPQGRELRYYVQPTAYAVKENVGPRMRDINPQNRTESNREIIVFLCTSVALFLKILGGLVR
jgi:hypothetical protein